MKTIFDFGSDCVGSLKFQPCYTLPDNYEVANPRVNCHRKCIKHLVTKLIITVTSQRYSGGQLKLLFIEHNNFTVIGHPVM